MAVIADHSLKYPFSSMGKWQPLIHSSSKPSWGLSEHFKRDTLKPSKQETGKQQITEVPTYKSYVKGYTISPSRWIGEALYRRRWHKRVLIAGSVVFVLLPLLPPRILPLTLPISLWYRHHLHPIRHVMYGAWDLVKVQSRHRSMKCGTNCSCWSPMRSRWCRFRFYQQLGTDSYCCFAIHSTSKSAWALYSNSLGSYDVLNRWNPRLDDFLPRRSTLDALAPSYKSFLGTFLEGLRDTL